jgi:hypothetical protein
MKKIMNKSSFYCCNTFWDYVEDGRIKYDPIFREYLFYINNELLEGPGVFGQSPCIYCPYCGTKIPSSLCVGDEYYDALEEAVGKEFCDIKEEEIPEEFKSDEWWKKRGL